MSGSPMVLPWQGHMRETVPDVEGIGSNLPMQMDRVERGERDAPRGSAALPLSSQRDLQVDSPLGLSSTCPPPRAPVSVKPPALKPAQLRQLKAQILACMHVMNNRPCDATTLKNARERMPDELVESENQQPLTYEVIYDDVDEITDSVVPKPASIDVKELAANREKVIRDVIESRRIGLESLRPDELNVQERLSALLEIRALSLAEMQNKIRQQLVHSMHHYCMLETRLDKRLYRRSRSVAIQTTNITEAMELKQRQELAQRKTRKHRLFLDGVLKWAHDFTTFHHKARENKSMQARAFVAYQQRREQERRKKQEQAERERLIALMEDNEEEYRKLVKEKKDERLSILLEETDKFVRKFADLVRTRRNTIRARTSGTENVETTEKDQIKEEEVIQSIVNGEDSVSKTYYLMAHTLGEKIDVQPKMMVGGQLKTYQMQGLEWMVSLYNNKLNGILADEMGLGKTIQTIALLSYLLQKKNTQGPFLITVPLSTMTNWQCEFAKWAPSVIVVRWEGKPVTREALAIELRNRPFNVLLTSYEYIMQDKAALSKYRWVYLIVDEGHRIKNEQSKLTKILNKYYKVDHRLLLTGTPLQNKLHELWALMNFLMPDIFDQEAQSFDEWLAAPFAGTGMKAELNAEEKMLVMGSLHKVLRPFILKRMKVDVAQQLPQKTEYIIRVKMSALQESVYRQIRENGLILAQNNAGGAKMRSLSNVEMHLRKILNHPYLFKEIESVVNPSKISGGAHLYRTCGKFELLDRLFTKLKESNHRVLLFCQMTSLLDIMEDFLTWKGLKYIRLDGSTCADERGALLTAFNAPGSDIFIFLLSTRAGGLGLNLQSADTVILYDSDWNPFQDLQAQDRAHRIGQKNEVRVLRLVTVGGRSRTVEECILDVAQRKLHIDAKVIQAGRFDNKTSAEERRRILETLVSRDEEFDQEDEDYRAPHTPHEVNDMLARGQEELDLFEQVDEEFFNSCRGQAKRLMSMDEVPPVYIDSGETLENMRRENLTETHGRGRREHKEVLYNEEIDDDVWAKAVDQGTLDDLIEQQRIRVKKRNLHYLSVGTESGADTNASISSTEGGKYKAEEKGRKVRGRLKTSRSLLSVDDATSSQGSPVARKRRNITRSPIENEDDAQSISKDDNDSCRETPVAPESDSEARITLNIQLMWILKHLCALKFDDANLVSDVFMKLPNRTEYADYYQIVTNPISLGQIKAKANKSQYHSFEEIEAALETMYQNARDYNEEGHWVIRFADLLKEEYFKRKSEVIALAAANELPMEPRSDIKYGKSCRARTADKSDWCNGCLGKHSCDYLKHAKPKRKTKHKRPYTEDDSSLETPSEKRPRKQVLDETEEEDNKEEREDEEFVPSDTSKPKHTPKAGPKKKEKGQSATKKPKRAQEETVGERAGKDSVEGDKVVSASGIKKKRERKVKVKVQPETISIPAPIPVPVPVNCVGEGIQEEETGRPKVVGVSPTHPVAMETTIEPEPVVATVSPTPDKSVTTGAKDTIAPAPLAV
eukprot:Ihof_evm1s228 gene=Ihof_evmTU1s228